MPPRKNKEKKVDREALGSHFMRIPGMDTETARDLIDLGFSHVYELAGRAPDALYDELKKKRPNIPERKLHLLRLAVYYSEEPEPEPSKLRPEAWVS